MPNTNKNDKLEKKKGGVKLLLVFASCGYNQLSFCSFSTTATTKS